MKIEVSVRHRTGLHQVKIGDVRVKEGTEQACLDVSEALYADQRAAGTQWRAVYNAFSSRPEARQP